MFIWFRDLFRPTPDRIEKMLLERFDFLINKYGFTYFKYNLGNYTDENGKLLFYGPYNAYQFFTSEVCLNILYLVQRDDFEVYITKKQYQDQLYIRKGTKVPAGMQNNMVWLAAETKTSVQNNGELFGFKVFPQ